MVFKNNIPQPSDILSDSQGDLLGNMAQLDTSFGTDHYPFSDLTANNGFHNQVTTPQFVTSPPVLPTVEPTTTTNPLFYGYQPRDAADMPTTQLGLLQYSKGPTNAVATPVTSLHSPSAPIVLADTATTTVLDFSGIPRAFCMLYFGDLTNSGTIFSTESLYYVIWNGPTLGNVLSFFKIQGTAILPPVLTGNTLKIKNSSGGALNNIYWTLQFLRLS